MESNIQELIYGKDQTQRVVAIEISSRKQSELELFIEANDGSIVSKFVPNQYWILIPKASNRSFPLDGNLHYKHALLFNTQDEFQNAAKHFYNKDAYMVWNAKEAAMIKSGITPNARQPGKCEILESNCTILRRFCCNLFEKPAGRGTRRRSRKAFYRTAGKKRRQSSLANHRPA